MASSGKLEIIKRLASGGMAEVFLARERGYSGIEKLVVVKQILPQHAKDPEYLRMFRDEARVAALLQHPNLVQMFDMGSRDGLPFITMEYLNGEDVRAIYRELRQQGQSLRVDYVLNIIVGVCAGLHYAHERVGLDGKPLHIVHRDISPQNVLVTFEGGVKVVDFGIAKSEGRQNQTQNAMIKGKIAYMPPEQVLGKGTDRRSDVYSVGIMLYEMTTGQRPYRNQSEVALMRMIVDDPIPPPRQLIPGYPVDLQAIVLKATAREAAERYQSAQDLQAALEEFARKRNLSLSSLALSKFMHGLFGEKANAYRDVLAGLKPLEALPLENVSGGNEVDQEPAEPDTSTGAVGLEDVPGAAMPAPQATPLASFEHADLERVGPVTVVHFKGKLNERFNGAEIGKVLSGPVVFDLAKVERVTSYGVREWLAMLAAAEPRLAGLYLARCSEAIVNQLSMIKKFAGSGRVASFLAPYACRACAKTFPVLIDVNQHAAILEKKELPPQKCATCGKDADFDDDARSFLAFSPTAIGPLVGPVGTVLAKLGASQEAPVEALEKLIEGSVTRVKVRAPLDGAIRWKRILDGVEGQLTIDLADSPGADESGLKQLSVALSGLGDEVSAVRVEGASKDVVERVSAPSLAAKVNVASVLLEGHCQACNTSRPTLLRREELLPALSGGHPLEGVCKRCNGPLKFEDPKWLAQRLVPKRAEAAPSSVKAATPAVAAAPAVVPASAPVTAGGKSLPPVVIGGALVVIAGLVAALVFLKPSAPAPVVTAEPVRPAPAPAVAPTPAAAPAATLSPVVSAPSYAGAPLTRSGGEVLVTGHGGPAAARAEAEAAAQSDALVRLSEELGQSWTPAVAATMKKHLGAGRLEGEALVSAVRRRLDGHVALALGSGAILEKDGSVEIWGRYTTGESTLEVARALWNRSALFRGATVMELPPELKSTWAERALVVVAVEAGSPAQRAGLRTTDLVVGIGDLAPPTLEGLKGALPNRTLPVRIVADGVSRTLNVAP